MSYDVLEGDFVRFKEDPNEPGKVVGVDAGVVRIKWKCVPFIVSYDMERVQELLHKKPYRRKAE